MTKNILASSHNTSKSSFLNPEQLWSDIPTSIDVIKYIDKEKLWQLLLKKQYIKLR